MTSSPYTINTLKMELNRSLRKSDLEGLSIEQLVNLYLLMDMRGDKRGMRAIETRFEESVSLRFL
jgi:hypothetical protein